MPVPRRRAPQHKGPSTFSCNNSPALRLDQVQAGVREQFILAWCSPHEVGREFDVGGPEQGTLVGARLAPGLYDPIWGQSFARASRANFDPDAVVVKLPGQRGWWRVPGIAKAPPVIPETSAGSVKNFLTSPLLGGALFDRLCKPGAPAIDWCCHQPGNYSYINFISTLEQLERYLKQGWTCEPRATSRFGPCQTGFTGAVKLAAPPRLAPGVPPRPTIAVTPPAPGAPPAPPGVVNLSCHPPGNPYYTNIVQDTVTLKRYLAMGWLCTAR